MKRDWFDWIFKIWFALIALLIITLIVILIYGAATGQLSTEELDTDNIWFWLFLLK